MKTSSVGLRQVLDWRLAVFAGLCGGTVFLVLTLLFAAFSWHISGWSVLRYMASIVLGAGVLPPPAGFDFVVVVVALLVNYALAIFYALVLAAIIHRWGFLVGLIGGALFGVAIYFINLYAVTLFFPWFFSLNSTALLISFIAFGAVTGSVYELFDTNDASLGEALGMGRQANGSS